MNTFLAFVFTYRGTLIALVLAAPLLFAFEPSQYFGLPLGFGVLLLGFALRIMGVRRIGSRARVHAAGSKRLITSGIFAHVRHPLYLGNALAIAGLVALYFSALGSLVTLTLLIVVYSGVAVHEERCLLQQKGEAYIRYLRHVPRWMLRLTPYKDEEGDRTVIAWREVVFHERGFIAGCALLAALSFPWRAVAIPRLFAADSESNYLTLFTAVLIVALGSFFRTAAHIQRKRGSWLDVDRLTG